MMKGRRILSLHLTSSSLFCLGTLIPVISYATAYTKGISVNTGLIEGVSWTLMTCHVLPEIIIDLNTYPKPYRKFPHMRYGTGPWVNFLQSIVFAMACIIQATYCGHAWGDNSGDSELDISAYRVFNLIAAHIWVASGIIAVKEVGSNIACCFDSPAGAWEQLVNDVYFVSTIILCIAAYAAFEDEAITYWMQVAVRFFWAILGIYYFMHDLIDEYSYKVHVGEEPIIEKLDEP